MRQIAGLVDSAALYQRAGAGDVAYRFAQRLGAVQHVELLLGEPQPAVDEVCQQRGRDGRVLRRSLPQRERHLRPISRDPELDDVRDIRQVDPIDQHDRQLQVREVAAEQLLERRARLGDERARKKRAFARAVPGYQKPSFGEEGRGGNRSFGGGSSAVPRSGRPCEPCGAGRRSGQWPGVSSVETKGEVAGVLERDRELERIGSALDAAVAGAGGVLLVEGPPGIGKTTLALAAVDGGRSRGVRVCRAAGRELERDFAYGVVRQLFDPVVRAAGSADRGRLLEGAGGAAAALHIASDGADGASGSEFATLYGLYWLVANLSDDGPMLLVVDDAHWSDVASLRFLAFLAPRLAELPMLLLMCARPDEWEPERLFAGTASDVAMRPLVPAPLSGEASAQMVRARFDEHADRTFCSACHTATGGNPFLLRALLDELVDEGVAPRSERRRGGIGDGSPGGDALDRGSTGKAFRGCECGCGRACGARGRCYG